jgi:L-2-hydroxyglutarate oxidase
MYADLLIVGGGLAGLATAYQLLQRRPEWRVVVLEKEDDIALHQSGRNSGLVAPCLHAPPGSRRAYHCRHGRGMLHAFCREEGLLVAPRSLVVVAISADELPALHALYGRALANGVDCDLIDRARLEQVEPHAAGVAALEVRGVTVVDCRLIAKRLALRIVERGGQVVTGQTVTRFSERPEGVLVQAQAGGKSADTVWTAPRLVNAAGLHADRLARQAGVPLTVQIAPFRGHYYQLAPPVRELVRGIIMPVPDPALPFPGIHLTHTLAGEVLAGPNAVWAGSREGYSRTTVSARDWWEQLRTPAVRRLTQRHLPTAWWEFRRSYSKRLFALTVQRLLPGVHEDELVPGPRTLTPYGLTAEGVLLADFVWQETARMVHLMALPGAGAAGTFSIGRSVADRMLQVDS